MMNKFEKSKNIVHLPVDNKRVDEVVVIDGWWRRMLNKIVRWFKRSSKEVVPVDELQQLRQRNKDKRTVLRCATILLNQPEPGSAAESKEGNVIDFRTMAEVTIKDD